MSETLYVCPSCKARNEEHLSYCKGCGSWLLSSAYPAKKVTKVRKGISGLVVTIAIVAVVAIGIYAWDNPAEFDLMSVGDVTLTQFVVERPFLRPPEAAADITAQVDISSPLEIRTIYYDSNGKRVGIASAMMVNGLRKGQTTTVTFEFEGSPKLSDIAQVRVEVKELAPFELLERAADRMSDLR